MAKLCLKRELKLLPYTPKPGDTMFNTLSVEVYRDADRKKIRFRAMPVKIEVSNGIRSLTMSIYGDDVRHVLAESPTHAPKKFDAIAGPVMESIDSRRGTWWNECLAFLQRNGMQVADGAA